MIYIDNGHETVMKYFMLVSLWPVCLTLISVLSCAIFSGNCGEPHDHFYSFVILPSWHHSSLPSRCLHNSNHGCNASLQPPARVYRHRLEKTLEPEHCNCGKINRLIYRMVLENNGIGWIPRSHLSMITRSLEQHISIELSKYKQYIRMPSNFHAISQIARLRTGWNFGNHQRLLTHSKSTPQSFAGFLRGLRRRVAG